MYNKLVYDVNTAIAVFKEDNHMKSIRRNLAVVMAVLATMTILLSGCSTPAIAMTVGSHEYTTGEYLANLYMNYYSAYYESGLYQYASYGMDPWEQTFPYGEGEDAVELSLSDYLVQVTQDGIIRQAAVKDLMAHYGITNDQEDLDAFYADMAEVKESELLAYGFNKEHYMNMYIAMNMDEQNLFYTLYDKDGQKAIPEEDIRKFFDEEYAAFKAITISQTDDEGKALSDADKQKNKEELQTYLDMFNKNNDMDAVIEQYEKDHTTTTTGKTTTTTTTGAATTTTTAVSTTTTTTTTTTTAASATTTTVTESDATTTTTGTTTTTDPNLQLINTVSGDEAVVDAVHTVTVGEAKIVEYTSGETAYIALIYRLDTEEAGGENYYEDQRNTILYGLKFEEFDAEVEAKIDTLTVDINKRAIKMCDPKDFETVGQ